MGMGNLGFRDSALRAGLAKWDGKNVTVLHGLYEEQAADDGFIESLVALIARQKLSHGASWLLKHHLASGHSLSEPVVVCLCKTMPSLRRWPAQLHILQCLPYITIPAGKKLTLRRFIGRSLESDNKFVRAWAYNGLQVLASQYPQYQARVDNLFEMALRDEAPSVRARIRQLQKHSPRGRDV